MSGRELSIEQKEQLEDWTELKFGEVELDSEWSEFNFTKEDICRVINGKKQIVFLIEDTDGNRFGYFSNTKITIPKNEYDCFEEKVSDSKSFEFDLDVKGRIGNAMKYEVKRGKRCIYNIYKGRSDTICYFGDIYLMKENANEKSFISNCPGVFDYQGIYDPFIGIEFEGNNSIYFEPRRIQIIQMEEKDQEQIRKRVQEKKKRKEDEEKKQEDERKEKRKGILKEMKETKLFQVKELEELTLKKCQEILFDSEVDEWGSRGRFSKDIIGKKELVFLIEEENGEIFGYYESGEIKEEKSNEENPKEKKKEEESFLFNLESKESLKKPMKFKRKGKETRYIEGSDSKVFIKIGDICLMKKERKDKSYYFENKDHFEFGEYSKVLCGKEPKEEKGEIYFTPKRILVIQMEKMGEMEESEIKEKRKNEKLREEYSKEEREKTIRKIEGNEIFDYDKLEELTGMKMKNLLFDSECDPWNTSKYLNRRIKRERRLLFFIEADSGEQFGYYLNSEVDEKYDELIKTDIKSFGFNFDGNNQFGGPKKYPIRDIEQHYRLYKENESEKNLIQLGDIHLKLEQYRNETYVEKTGFEFCGIQNPDSGNKFKDEGIIHITPKRIFVLQMEEYPREKGDKCVIC